MDLLSQLKKFDLVRSVMQGDTAHLSPYPFVPQKPKPVLQASPSPLPRSTPEEQGVPSQILAEFIRQISTIPELLPHSLLVLRHGAVIAQGDWSPFRHDCAHIVYSISKSITSMAVGMAVSEGLLSLEEKIVDIFPEKVNFLTSRTVRSITIQHLLTMQSGATFNEMGSYLKSDWVRAFLEGGTSFEPGSKFSYNSTNTYMLAAILHRKTGQTLVEYLRPRLFDPMQLQITSWETCPQGIEKGGWGLYLHPEDMAKLGQLYLQKGRWNVQGEMRQLVPEDWVLTSTTPHIKDTGDGKGLGYGYQIWLEPSGRYEFNGLFGQYIFVIPQHDMVVALTAGSSNLLPRSPILDQMDRFFGPQKTFSQAALPPDPAGQHALQFVTSHLVFRKPVPSVDPSKAGVPPMQPLPWWKRLFQHQKRGSTPVTEDAALSSIPVQAQELDGHQYLLASNTAGLLPLILQCSGGNFASGIQRIGFLVHNGCFKLEIQEDQLANRISIGFGAPLYSIVELRGEQFLVGTTGDFTTDEDDHLVLKLQICFVESACTRLIKCFFLEGNRLRIAMDETPGVLMAIEKFFVPALQGELLKKLGGSDNDFVEFKLQKFATPTLKGMLSHT